MDLEKKVHVNQQSNAEQEGFFDTDHEPSDMEIPTTKMTEEREHGSLSIMMSRSKKMRSRLSEAPRVVFADEQGTPHGVSSEEGSIVETNVNDRKDGAIIPAMEADVRASDIGGDEFLREIQAERTKHLGPGSEILGASPVEAAKGADFGQALASRKRSTVFLGYPIDEMLGQFPLASGPTFRQDERESSTDNKNASVPTFGGCDDSIFQVPRTDHLSPLEAEAFAAVLREATDTFGLLEHVIPARVDEGWDEGYRTIDEKYGTTEETRTMFGEEAGPLPPIPTVFEKLQRDRTYAYNVLKGTTRDLRCLRRHDRLETEVDDIARTLQGERNLEMNNQLWTSRVKQLRDLIEFERRGNERETSDLLITAQAANAEIDAAVFSNISVLDFVERWENARLDQQKLRLEAKEREINDALESRATMERIDEILSGEARTFLQAHSNDLEKDTAAWASRYSEEIELVQVEINEMKEKIELQKLDVEKLEEQRNELLVFFQRYYAEKELAESEAEYRRAVNKAATLLQSLWRGHMVRRELGVYKKLWAALRKKKPKKTPKKRGKRREK